MTIQRKRVAKRLASGLLAGALAFGGLAIGVGGASANTPSSPTTNRIYGSDRYETAAALARAQLNTTSAGAISATNPDSLIIASGENFPDALAGGQLATNTRPLLLVRKDSVPSATSDFIADYKSSFATGSKRVFILGGEAAISAETVTAIQSAITTAGSLTPPVITRLSGATRYETAKAISDYTAITQADDSLIIANGATYEDAVTASSLAAFLGWPMILTPSSGLNDTVKAKLDSFIALPGGTDQFVIIGAGIPAEIESYLISTKSIAPAKIRRIQGADHYQTNFLANANYLLTNYSGANVGLVTGENWPDALAFAGFGKKTGTHLVLTPTAGGNVNVLTLAATLAAYNDAGYGTNQRLFVIGGRSAVSDVAKVGYAAASGTDLTSSISCGEYSAATQNQVTITLSGRLNGTAPAFENATMLSLPALSSVMKKNNVALTGSVSAISDRGAATLTPTRKTYRLTLGAPLVTGDVITFSGMEEGELIGTTGAQAFPRSIGSSSCTVAADVTRPTVSITGVAGTGGTDSASGGYFWIHASEPITVGSGLAVQVDAGGTKVSTITLDGVNPTLSATVVPMSTATSRGGFNYYTDFIMVLKDISAGAKLSTSAQVPNESVLNVSASVFADAAGLNPSSLVSSTVGTDSASPSLVVAATKSDATGVATYSISPLSISAKATGAYFGAKGSGFAVSVVNQRGLLKPTFAVDGTAKTITITADTGYHTPSDVAQAVANAENSDWAVNASSTRLNASVSPASCLAATCGFDTVSVLLVANEPVHGFQTGVTISVGGYGSPFVGNITDGAGDTVAYGQFDVNDALMNIDTAKVITFTTQFEGAATMSFQGASAAASGIVDLVGNYLTAPVTFTVT